MVKICCMTILAFTIGFGVEGPRSNVLPTVVSAEVAKHGPLTIKPCQRTYVFLEVEVDHAVTTAIWKKTVRKMSESVRVNGKEFRNRLSDVQSILNDAARFVLLNPPLGMAAREPDARSKHALIMVDFCMNGKEAGWLFTEAGEYDIELFIGDDVIAIKVDVDEPTEQEREIISAITPLPVLAFLRDPRNHQYATKETVSLIEPLAQYDTDYKRMLSLALGLRKRPTSADPPSSKEEGERRELEGARWRYESLVPYCSGEITSELEALATFRCGVAAWMLAANEKDRSKAAEYAARRDELLRKAVQSPLTAGAYVSLAEQILAGLEAERKAAEKDTSGT